MALQGKDLGALVGQLGMDTKQWDTALTKMQEDMGKMEARAMSSMQKIQQSFSGMGRKLQSTGRNMSVAITAPLTAFAGLSLKTAGDFEVSMNRVRALSGATGDELQKLEAIARELGASTQFMASDAADAMGFLAMAGMEVNDIMRAMPDTLTLAASAQLDMATAADIVTNVLAGYNMEVSELSHATDVLVKAFTSANTDLQQLAHAMKYAGPIAQAAGVQFEEAAAAMALMGNAGIQGSMAGTSLRGALSRILNPTQQITKAMEKASLKFTDASGRLLPLSEIIQQLEPHANNAGLFMQLFGQRAGPAMAALVTQGSDSVRKLTQELENSGGIAKSVADVQMEGFNGALMRLKSVFEELQIAFANSGLLDFASELADRLTEVIRRISQADSEVLNMTFIFGGFAAAVGPVLIALGTLMTLLGGLTAPIAGIVVAAAAAGAAIVANWDDVVAYFTDGAGAQMWKDFTGIIKGAVKIISDIWETFGDEFLAVVKFSFGQVLEIVETTLSRVHELMRVFNGDFEKELNIWEDNVLTTVQKIRNILIGTTVEAFRIAGRSIKEVFFTSIGDFDIDISALGISGTVEDIDKVAGKISELSAEITRVRERAEKGLISTEQRDIEIARLEGYIAPLEALRTQILRNIEARGIDTESIENATAATGGLTDSTEDQTTSIGTLQEMLSKNMERYDAIISKVGELTAAEVREAAALLRQNALIEEQINARERLIGMQNESIRSTRDVAGTTEQAVERISQSWLQTVPTIKTSLQQMREQWEETEWRIEQAARAMQNSLINLGSSFMESLGFIIATGDGIGQAFLGILENIADMAIRLGTIIVASGKAIEELRNALITFFGGSAIVAGAALIAIGSAAKGAIRGLASSGSRGGGGRSVTPQAPTATSVPQRDDQVVFRIGNNELIGTLQQAGIIDQRVGKRRKIIGT